MPRRCRDLLRRPPPPASNLPLPARGAEDPDKAERAPADGSARTSAPAVDTPPLRRNDISTTASPRSNNPPRDWSPTPPAPARGPRAPLWSRPQCATEQRDTPTHGPHAG